MAQKISEVREELDELKDVYAQTASDLDALTDLVRRQHDDTHSGAFQYCAIASCHFASRVTYDPDTRPFL